MCIKYTAWALYGYKMNVLESVSARINSNVWIRLPCEAREKLVHLADDSSIHSRDLHFVYRGNECIVSGKWRNIRDFNNILEYYMVCIENAHHLPSLESLWSIKDASSQTDPPFFEDDYTNSVQSRRVTCYSTSVSEVHTSKEFSPDAEAFDGVILSPCLEHFESPHESPNEQSPKDILGNNYDNSHKDRSTLKNLSEINTVEQQTDKICDNTQVQRSEVSKCNSTDIAADVNYPQVDQSSQKIKNIDHKGRKKLSLKKDPSGPKQNSNPHLAGAILRKRRIKTKQENHTPGAELEKCHNDDHDNHSLERKTNSLYTKKKRLKAKLEGKRLRLLNKLNEPNVDQSNSMQVDFNMTTDNVEKTENVQPKKRGRKPKIRNPNDFFHCKYCPYTTKVAARLANHMNRKHEERKYSCQLCDKSFGTKADQKRHELGHSESYICDICGKVYKSKTFVEQHRKKHHENFVKPEFPCEICHKVFTAKCSLKQHIEFIHNGNRRKFLCRFCGKSFTQKRHMTEHENKHTGRKPYVCKVCGSTFHHSSSLRSHEIIHSEKRDFSCDVCGKAFRTKQALVVHKFTHAESGRFKCDTCDKTFTQKQAMLRHARIHTGERPYTCDLCCDKFNDRSILRRHLIGVHKLPLDKLPKGRRRQFDVDLEGLKEGNPGAGLSGALEAEAMNLQGCDIPENGVLPTGSDQSQMIENTISSADVDSAERIESMPPELSSISNQHLVSDPIYSHAMSFNVAVAQMHDLGTQAPVQPMALSSGQTVLDSYNHIMTHHLTGHSLSDQVGHHALSDHHHHMSEHHHVTDHHHVQEHHLTDHQINDHQMTEQVADHHLVDHQMTESHMADHHIGDHQLTDHHHHQLPDHQHQISDAQMELQLTAEQLADHQLNNHNLGDNQVTDPHLTAQALSAQQLDHTIHPVSSTSLVPDQTYSQTMPGTLGASSQDLTGLPEPPPAHRHLATGHYFNGLVSDPQGLPVHQSILPHMSYLTQPQDHASSVTSYGTLLDAHAQHLHNLHSYGTL